jgi:hypothetical protein
MSNGTLIIINEKMFRAVKLTERTRPVQLLAIESL